MTIAEIEVIQKAEELRKLDERFNISMLAWRNAQAQSTDKRGESVYKKFDSFFNYEEEYEKILRFDEKSISNEHDLYRMIRKANEEVR